MLDSAGRHQPDRSSEMPVAPLRYSTGPFELARLMHRWIDAGKCTCGKEMVKAQVTKAEEGKASLKVAGWEKECTFKTTGQYACACGPTCKCNSISQNPGKCTCGTKRSKVK